MSSAWGETVGPLLGRTQRRSPFIPRWPRLRGLRNETKRKLAFALLRARRLGSREEDGEVWGEDSFPDEPSAMKASRLGILISPLPFRLNYRCPWRVLIRD